MGVPAAGIVLRTERLRNDRNEQVLVVGEYLLIHPYGHSDTRTAAKAFIERFRAR